MHLASRVLTTLLSGTLFAGCASVEIIRADIVAVGDEGVTIEIQTNRNVATYEDSMYAHHVYLDYEVSGTSISSKFSNPVQEESFPFSIAEKEYFECKNGGFCSSWEIPRENSIGLALVNYRYELKIGDHIRVEIGGGTMSGSTLRSNTVTVELRSLRK